jgi:hypothetical protein
MKSDRQLNHPLEMPTQGAMTGYLTPSVFEDFMGVEKVGAVEQIKTSVEFPAVWGHGHSGLAFSDCGTLRDNLRASIED